MSTRTSFWTNGNVEVRIERVEGDLEIVGRDQREVVADADEDADLRVEQNGSTILVRCESDVELVVPTDARVNIVRVGGDLELSNVLGEITLIAVEGSAEIHHVGPLTVQQVDGDLEASAVHGECHLRQVEGDAEISRVYGNLAVDGIGGDCEVREIYGNVVLSGVGGDCEITQVQGTVRAQCGDDLHIENVRGAVEVQAGDEVDASNLFDGDLKVSAGGDADLRFELAPGHTYRVEAGGNIECRVPEEASARVRLQAGGELNVRRIESIPIVNGSIAEFTLGSGDAMLSLLAGGDIDLSSGAMGKSSGFRVDIDFGGKTSEEIAAAASNFTRNILIQVESGLRSVTRTLDEKLSNLGSSEEIAGRVHEKVQTAIRRAEEKVAEAVKDAERRAHEAEARLAEMENRQKSREGRGGNWRPGVYWGPHPPTPPPPPPRPGKVKTPVGEQERLMILRMVSEGKISVEQAEQLLSALNG